MGFPNIFTIYYWSDNPIVLPQSPPLVGPMLLCHGGLDAPTYRALF